jgi:hypothetical protein
MAQDKIYLRNTKGNINAKITEVGLDELKYKETNNLDGPQFTLEKDDIEKIVYSNGRTETFEQTMSAKVSLKEMRKNNLKLAFLSPRLGHTHLSYEKGIKQGQSWEVHASIIGLGIKEPYDYIYNPTTQTNQALYRNQRGLMIGAGYKFGFTPDYITRGTRSRHILQGSFFRPSAYLGGYRYSTHSYNVNNGNIVIKKKNVITGAVMAEVGKQWTLSNRASFEYYLGFGYGFDNSKRVINDYQNIDDFASFYYLYLRLSNNSPSNSFLAISSGVKFGYLFHTPKEKKLEKEKKVLK